MRLLDFALAVLMLFGLFGLGGALLGGGATSAVIGLLLMTPYVVLNLYRGYAGTPAPATPE